MLRRVHFLITGKIEPLNPRWSPERAGKRQCPVELAKVKKEQRTVIKYPKAKTLPNHKIVSLDCDVLITAAIPDLISNKDVKGIKAKLIVEGSNIPMSLDTEQRLYKKGVLVVPDFVANAGGVISSYVEYINGSPAKMFKMVEKKILENTKAVLKESKRRKICPRTAAMNLAQKRVKKKL